MRDLKVFYTCYQPYLLDVALRMHREYNWEPVYWFTWDAAFPEVGATIRSTFPGIITHDYHDAIRGKEPARAAEIPVIPNDAAILEAMSKYETTVLCMMDRNDLLGVFTYKERLNSYHFQIRYWNSVLEHIRPDLIMMEAVPHEPSDLVLYYVARMKGIKTLMFNLAHTFDRVTTMETFEAGPDLVIKRYEELLSGDTGEPVELSEQNETYLRKIRGNYNDNLREDVKISLDSLAVIRQNQYLVRMKSLLRSATYIFNLAKWKGKMNYLQGLNKPSLHSYHKLPGIPFSNSVITNSTFNKATEKAFRLKKELHRYYDSIANRDLELETPFIYCPLHYQPEATTSPLGEQFVNQHLIVEMLAYNLPAGWKVCVKEHRAQFQFNLWGEPSRSKEYYDRLLRIPNVEIVPLGIDPYTLIDKCKVVATISGAVCMEATMRGKAVLAFGHSIIYYPCEGIFYTPTNKELRTALDKVTGGYVPEEHKIRLFVKAVEENSFRGGLGTAFNNGAFGIYRKENAEGHYQALMHWINNYNKIHPND
jgi:hypothetical protein